MLQCQTKRQASVTHAEVVGSNTHRVCRGGKKRVEEFVNTQTEPKIRDGILSHAGAMGWMWIFSPFCVAGRAPAPRLAGDDSFDGQCWHLRSVVGAASPPTVPVRREATRERRARITRFLKWR